jgi:chemotaxis protein MotB
MARKKQAHAGGHGWFVTFADLMGLLVSFFVMLVAFSTQDKQKLQIVAGSMRDAFGTQTKTRYSGIVEVDGLPTKPKLRYTTKSPDDASDTPTPEDRERSRDYGVKPQEDRAFALAAASLRQALQDLPEISELSRHVMIEESRQGLNIEIVDQDGRSMFPEGSKEPFERTRRLIQKLAGPLKAMPNRIAITGHTSATAPSRRCPTGLRLPGTHPPPGLPRGPATARGNYPLIARTQCGKSSRTRACPRPACSWWPARRIPSRCFPTIHTFQQTVV